MGKALGLMAREVNQTWIVGVFLDQKLLRKLSLRAKWLCEPFLHS
jgi:hypothetical protein